VKTGAGDRRPPVVGEPGVRRAADVAEHLRRELTHARVELELFERRRVQPTEEPPPARDSSPGSVCPSVPDVLPGSVAVAEAVPSASRLRAVRSAARRHGIGLGIWLITLYLLVTLLSLTPPEPVGTRAEDRTAAVVRADDTPGRAPTH
jgi:hypothetical protein